MSKLPSLPRALLFDLDGTLADTAPDLAAAVNKMRTDRALDETPFEIWNQCINGVRCADRRKFVKFV